MKKFDYLDWHFTIDREKNRLFYAARPVGYPVAENRIDELQHFMKLLGVDIQKPVAVSQDLYEAVFIAYGTAETETGYELDFLGNGAYVSIIIWPGEDCGLTNGEDSVFSFGIENYQALLK